MFPGYEAILLFLQAAASLEAVQVIPPHLRTQQHAAATLDLLNKDLGSQKR